MARHRRTCKGAKETTKMRNQDENKNYKYDIAFSFSREDRDFVDNVWKYLRDDICVFYIESENKLVGNDFYNSISKVFMEESHFCAVFISKSYLENDWTRHELEFARERTLKQSNYIIPIRLDETEIPGMLLTIGYINGHEGPRYVADILKTFIFQSVISKDGSLDRPIDKKLSVVDWRITCECDHTCRCCFGPKDIAHLDLYDAKKIVDKLQEQGVNAVCISGGEPLVYPYIDEILTYLNNKGIEIYLSTNGNHFWEHRTIIELYITKLSLSLDGPIENIHSRGGKDNNNFNNVINILEYYKYKKRSFQIKVGTLLSANNISIDSLLLKIYNLLEKYPIDIWKISQLVPEGKVKYEIYSCECTEGLFNYAIDQFEFGKIKHPSPNFQIVISRRKERDRAYFIIQPNGAVIIPEDNGKFVEEIIVLRQNRYNRSN
jgi:MoaA/NifB/PqqE/SkfB family radical SAM enzyme